MDIALGVAAAVWVVGAVVVLATAGAVAIVVELEKGTEAASVADLREVELEVRRSLDRVSQAYLADIGNLFPEHQGR